jgi:hypothetical protein
VPPPLYTHRPADRTAEVWGSHPDHDEAVAMVSIQLNKNWSMPLADQAAAAVDPCPNCGQPVSGLANGRSYQIDVAETGGKSHKGDIPPCPVPGMFGALPMVYAADPCGCRVSTLWASTYQIEVNSRADGRPPKAVQIPEATRLRDLKQMEANLGRLYSVQTTSDPDSSTRKAADFWVVVVADQIQRLCPGKHNTKPSPKPLNATVAAWAKANGLTVPGVEDQEGEGVGVPLFSQPNGTMGKTPSHAGQKPSGFVAGGQPSDPDKLELMAGLSNAGLISKKTFKDEVMAEFGYGTKYPMPKQPKAKANDQADALAFAMTATGFDDAMLKNGVADAAALKGLGPSKALQNAMAAQAAMIAKAEAAAYGMMPPFNGDPTGTLTGQLNGQLGTTTTGFAAAQPVDAAKELRDYVLKATPPAMTELMRLVLKVVNFDRSVTTAAFFKAFQKLDRDDDGLLKTIAADLAHRVADPNATMLSDTHEFAKAVVSIVTSGNPVELPGPAPAGGEVPGTARGPDKAARRRRTIRKIGD